MLIIHSNNSGISICLILKSRIIIKTISINIVEYPSNGLFRKIYLDKYITLSVLTQWLDLYRTNTT